MVVWCEFNPIKFKKKKSIWQHLKCFYWNRKFWFLVSWEMTKVKFLILCYRKSTFLNWWLENKNLPLFQCIVYRNKNVNGPYFTCNWMMANKFKYLYCLDLMISPLNEVVSVRYWFVTVLLQSYWPDRIWYNLSDCLSNCFLYSSILWLWLLSFSDSQLHPSGRALMCPIV